VCGLTYGLCLVNLTTFFYFTLVTPLVYQIFLVPFFRADQQAPAFSYKAQVSHFFFFRVANPESFAFRLFFHHPNYR
jgi:hypothetical protein